MARWGKSQWPAASSPTRTITCVGKAIASCSAGALRGIQLDQSKGASKPGEAGFNFGTCHPYFPVEFDGSPIDVLELPTPTQDLNVFAPETLLRPLLDPRRRHGILHLLFHPTHTIRETSPAHWGDR